jgi:hypothetical protein
MNQLPYLNVAKPTPTNYGLTTIKEQNINSLYITQHVKPPLLLLVDESGLLPLLSGLPNLSRPVQEF